MANNKVRQDMTIGVIGFEPTASSSRTTRNPACVNGCNSG